jgi:hypothetical protein
MTTEEKKLWKGLKSNDRLVAFNKRIISLTNVFNNYESRYFFLVALISSDSLIDVESCDRSIEFLEFIIKNINLINVDDKSQEILEFYDSNIVCNKNSNDDSQKNFYKYLRPDDGCADINSNYSEISKKTKKDKPQIDSLFFLNDLATFFNKLIIVFYFT